MLRISPFGVQGIIFTQANALTSHRFLAGIRLTDLVHSSLPSGVTALCGVQTKVPVKLRTSASAHPVARKADRAELRIGDLVATGMKAGLSLYGVAILARVFILY